LKHKPESKQSWFYRTSERAFESVIEFYGKTLTVVLRHQPITMLVAVATLVATIYLYMIAPKGFFPVQDTGVIMGISEAPQDISFAAMSTRQQALARVILKDPAVQSLSSFIGIDGTNPTTNSGRIQINLKPIDERKVDATAVIRRLQPEVEQVSGINLFMQPVQDLTVETRVSRTQYQYSLEDARAEELNVLAPQFVDKLRTLPQLRDVASDQQNEGRQLQVTIDRR
jgi:multidrug efflux pump